ncbi:MAG: hypothetical protein V4684_04745 [Pseudomonadota bacterium]
MLSHRTRLSLVQLLAQQAEPAVATLLAKYGADLPFRGSYFADGLREAVQALTADQALSLAAEAVATRSALRQTISPKGPFDERFADFERCLLLDGYEAREGALRRTDPSLAGAPAVEDDLIAALLASAAPSRDDIVRKVQDSAQAFRKVPPDYNAALTNARVALETMARDVALCLLVPGEAPPYDPAKWGSMITFLKVRGEISQDEEVGLAGVYRFISPGAHRSVGVSEAQMTRLGRTFALNMCWFLLHNRLARAVGTPTGGTTP